jgi:hypothetical protein
MSETARSLYIETVDKLKYQDFINFIKKTEPDLEIKEDEVQEVYCNIVNNRVYTSGGNLGERTYIYLFIMYVENLGGFVFSSVDISGWDPVICLLTKDPIERKVNEILKTSRT